MYSSPPSRTIQLQTDFVPRAYQAKFMRYLERGGKRAVWVVHRRGGKDLTALHQTCRMAHKRVGQYWHVYPFAEQGRKAIWEGFRSDGKRIIDDAFPDVLVKRKNEQQMMIEFKNGSIWHLMGSDRIEVVGAGPVGVVFSEFALSKPNTWDMIRPMLRENGGWAAFITTPRGRNHAWKLYDMAGRTKGWWRDLQTLEDTRAYDPETTIAEERAEGMPEALIRQEYLCDWTAALVGSVFGDQIGETEKAGRIGDFEHPRDGVFTSWDLGLTDSTAIWFWRLNASGGLDFVDHYEAHGQRIPHYVDVLERKGYSYRMHWLPHDGAADTLSSMSSSEDQLRLAFPGKVQIGPKLSLVDGIQAGRWLLNQPCRFHGRTAKGVEALRAYRYGWDEEDKVFDKKPVHDWSSHTADAFRYAAVVAKVTGLIMRKPPAPKEPVVGPADRAWSLDQLFADAAKDKGNRRI